MSCGTTALIWKEKKEFDHALEDLNESIRLNPNYAIAFRNRASVWFEKGNKRRAHEDAEEAMRLNPAYRLLDEVY